MLCMIKNNIRVIEINPRMSGSFAILTRQKIFIINIFRKYLKNHLQIHIKKFNFKLFPKINLIKG